MDRILIPKQPFMVELADSYLTYKLGKYGISSFYFFEVSENVSKIDTSVPDGCIDIIFHYKRDGSEVGADFYGTTLVPHELKCYKGCCHFGVRFMLGIVPAITDVYMKDIVDKVIPFEQLSKLKQLPYQIAQEKSFMDQINFFVDVYVSECCAQNRLNREDLNIYLIQQMVKRNGNITVEEMSEKLGYSVSYIEKSFKNTIGITPKKFSKIIRVQSLISVLNLMKNPDFDGTALAYDYGYYDQSHMIHEFKQFSTKAPGEYIENLNRVKYDSRLKVIHDDL